MSVDEIIAAVFCGLVLISLIVLCIVCINSAEKTENDKRALFKELTKYYSLRNKQFEEDEDK